MTNVYGPFLLGKIPTETVQTEAESLALLEQFAAKGFCNLFREVIEGRAVEIRMVDGAPTHRWLEGAEADAILSLQSQGGWAPYSLFDYLDGIGTVFTPSGNFKGEAWLPLGTGDDFEMYVQSASAAMKALRTINTRLRRYAPDYWYDRDYPLEMYLELHNTLVRDLEECRKVGVIYTF